MGDFLRVFEWDLPRFLSILRIYRKFSGVRGHRPGLHTRPTHQKCSPEKILATPMFGEAIVRFNTSMQNSTSNTYTWNHIT